jgi:hypothetical protein
VPRFVQRVIQTGAGGGTFIAILERAVRDHFVAFRASNAANLARTSDVPRGVTG